MGKLNVCLISSSYYSKEQKVRAQKSVPYLAPGFSIYHAILSVFFVSLIN